MEEQFSVRSYKKTELARLYFPELDAKTGVQKIRRWIQRCQPLAKELEAARYRSQQKEFTARQVRLIIRHLGEP